MLLFSIGGSKKFQGRSANFSPTSRTNALGYPRSVERFNHIANRPRPCSLCEVTCYEEWSNAAAFEQWLWSVMTFQPQFQLIRRSTAIDCHNAQLSLHGSLQSPSTRPCLPQHIHDVVGDIHLWKELQAGNHTSLNYTWSQINFVLFETTLSIYKWMYFSSSSFEPVLSIHCLGARDLGASVVQPFDCLIVQNRQGVQSMRRLMDWTLGDNMADGLFLCATLTSRRGGHTPFVQTGAEGSANGAEAVKPDPPCSWEGHCWKVGAGAGDESTESRKVVQPLRLPLVIRLERRTYVVVRWNDELLCCEYKWVSRFETLCTRTRWGSERWVEQVSRLPDTAC